MKENDIHPLNSLVGRELSSVEFVRDYIQLHFDGPYLTMITDPVVYVGNINYQWGAPKYRDVLCDRIGKTVSKAFVMEDEALRVEFADGASVMVSLKAEDYVGAEAVLFRNKPDELWVW